VSNRYDGNFIEAGRQYALDWRLLKAIARQESNFDPNAINPADPSYGLMQVSLSTARALGYTGHPEGLLAPAVGIEWGAKALADIARRHRTVDAQLAVYNGGERGGVPRAWLADAEPVYRERVRGYVERVLSFYRGYQAAHPLTPPSTPAPVPRPVPVPRPGAPAVTAGGAPGVGRALAVVLILGVVAFFIWRALAR